MDGCYQYRSVCGACGKGAITSIVHLKEVIPATFRDMAQFQGDVMAAVQRYPKFDIFPNEFFWRG